MSDLTAHIVIVIVPLALSNSIHMVLVKKDIFPVTSIPIWSWGFGKNKTWRGLLFVPFANGVVLMLISFMVPLSIEAPAILGFELGLAYMLFELPNSFLKRR